jgi:hypothetical protein
MKRLNPDLPVVIVGGRPPLYQKQGTAGFDSKGNYLGEFDAQSEPIKIKAAKESAGDAPLTGAALYESLKVKDELLPMLESRGIEVPKKYNKAQLVALLMESDEAVASTVTELEADQE